MKRWIEKHSIGISLVPVVAVMAMIFFFSSQTGDQSGSTSAFLSRWVAEHFVLGYHTLAPGTQEMLRNTVDFIIRKSGHFLEYALLGTVLLLHIRQIQRRVAVRCPWLWAWAIGTLYAMSDEIHQSFIPERSPSAADVLLDSFGVLAGIIVLFCMWRWHRNLRKKTGALGS